MAYGAMMCYKEGIKQLNPAEYEAQESRVAREIAETLNYNTKKMRN